MQEIILELIELGKYAEVRNHLVEMNEVDIAALFEELDKQKLLVLFRILPKDIASGVFTHMSYELQRYIIETITDREARSILDELFLDDTVDFIEEMPANVVKKVLKNTDENTRRMINQILNYPEESAGSIMTIEYVDLKRQMTVKQAINLIKEIGLDKETIDTCYVIDKNRILEGVVSIRKIILSDEECLIEDIMDTNIVYAHTHDDQEELAHLFKKYDYFVMPVVDTERRLVGIVTIDDIVDVIEQETTEDFQKMAAMSPSEKEYLKTNAFVLAKNRIPWLLILMVSATFTGAIIEKYDNALQSVIVLASFIPMLMDTGGNAGSQSSTLIIRGLAIGEINMKDVFKVLWKELQVSCLAGLVLSVVNFFRVYYISSANHDLKVSLTVSITLFFTVILAKIVGGTLPLAAKKVKVDPAIMASPLITTIVDAFALMLYFSIATLILGI